MKLVQLTLFDEEPEKVAIKPRGGSQNPIVFHDYESYIAKFQNKEKTTDDTYTPQDVYEAVVKYVDTIYPLEGKQILRPFYPGGDYENAEYPEDGVVIDNPPFSIFMQICKFYSKRNIPFFIFGPGLTIMSAMKYCSVVIISVAIKYSNGAQVNTGFATNMLGDTMVTTSLLLDGLIRMCSSQSYGRAKKKTEKPYNVFGVSDFQMVLRRSDKDVTVKRDEGEIIRELDNGKKLYGDHVRALDRVAKEIVKIKEQDIKEH